jgi:RimJ/RimL family protein N-acetyltransferase
LLEGKNVNLKIVEREDLPLLHEWDNNPESKGEFEQLREWTKTDLEKLYDNLKDEQWFFIERKDGTKVGDIVHVLSAGEVEIGYFVVPDERKKGYATESIMIMIDYLFLSKNLERIQAKTDPENIASCKALEKAGFKREGILRKAFFNRGKWKDDCMYSILREEWKEPKILTKATQK